MVAASESNNFKKQREEMVRRQIQDRGIANLAVLEAMKKIPRHQYVPVAFRQQAYADRPLSIGQGQTISQPYVVALMTELAQPKSDSRALDIGTGSGYQAAILAEIVDEVYSIEIVETLASEADARLSRLGYRNIQVRNGDGYRGWPEKAPFDVIIVAAAPDHIPQPLIDQLAPGGHLVIPVGDDYQQLEVVEKKRDGTVEKRTISQVAFVPMTGEARNIE